MKAKFYITTLVILLVVPFHFTWKWLTFRPGGKRLAFKSALTGYWAGITMTIGLVKESIW